MLEQQKLQQQTTPLPPTSQTTPTQQATPISTPTLTIVDSPTSQQQEVQL